MAQILELAKSFPELGRECIKFIKNPRQVVVSRKEDWSKPFGVYSTAGTMVAVVILCFTLYGLLFGSLNHRVQSARLNKDQQLIELVSSKVSSPEYVDWALNFGVGAGVWFPEGLEKLSTEPQIAMFRFGAVRFQYNNVIPEKLSSGSALLILKILFAFLMVICIHPFAVALKGKANLKAAAKFGILFFSYTIASGSILAVITAVVFIEFIQLKGFVIMIPWCIFVLIPFAAIGLRGYFGGFSELYVFSKRKVLLSTVGGTLLSCVVGPLLFLPVLHIVLILQPYLDALV